MKIILPCAGMGTRLGLPYPKEIHLIAEQTALIDLTFRRLQQHKHSISEVIVILSPEKMQLVDYLAKWREDFYLKFIYFNEKNFEWAGSILSAEKEFGEKNIVFLPDSFLVGKPEFPILATFDEQLKDHGVCFGYLPATDRKTLKSLGALMIEDGRVADFCDKPDMEDKRQFNAFWTTFGFRAETGRLLLEMMTRSIQRQSVDIGKLQVTSAAFPVQEYKDLGVWPNIVEFQKQMASSKTPFPAH